MRIISGSARGRRIEAPKGLHTRPTLDRVKESLFNIIQYQIPGARVLDIFAGSGSLGLEALSRGAIEAVFIDDDRECSDIIKKNITSLGFNDKASVIKTNAMHAIPMLKGVFDIVFMDPHYALGAQDVLEALFRERVINKDGITIVEHDGNVKPKGVDGLMELQSVRKYGHVYLSFFSPV